MQKLLLKKKEKDPFEPEVKFEDFVSEENPLKENLSKLFGSLLLAELEQEGKAVEIEIDEENKKIKIRLEKKKEKKALEKRGKTYKIRKEMERSILTLVYNLPSQNQTQTFEKPEIADRKKMHAKLFSTKVAQSKQIIDNVPVRQDFTLKIKADELDPLKYEIYEIKPLEYENYEEMFDTANDGGNLIIPYELRETIKYKNPEPLQRKLSQTQVQKPRQITVYRTITMQGARAGETVLGYLKRSGHRFTLSRDNRYGILIESVDGIKSGYKGAYWEFYVNGKLASTGVSSYVLKKGDVVTWKLMKGGCSGGGNKRMPSNIWNKKMLTYN